MDQIKINLNNKEVQIQQAAKGVEELKQISAKLHPEYDQDLIQRINQIPKRDRSKVYRDALRKYFKETDMG